MNCCPPLGFPQTPLLLLRRSDLAGPGRGKEAADPPEAEAAAEVQSTTLTGKGGKKSRVGA